MIKITLLNLIGLNNCISKKGGKTFDVWLRDNFGAKDEGLPDWTGLEGEWYHISCLFCLG